MQFTSDRVLTVSQIDEKTLLVSCPEDLKMPNLFRREFNPTILRDGCNPGLSGINQAALALALIGKGVALGHQSLSGYETRPLPHFRQKGKANKKKRGK